MPRKASQRADYLRRALAEEAARIMAEQGIEDYRQAKRKAAVRLGVADRSALPKNVEIEAALRERTRIFSPDTHAQRLHRLRSVAREAMIMLEEFQPRLVGAVLSGTITETSPVDLHVFADAPEIVALALIDRSIRHDFGERRFRFAAARTLSFPVLRFDAEATAIEATVFPPGGVRQSPCSPVDGRPMRRARLAEVERLLNGGAD